MPWGVRIDRPDRVDRFAWHVNAIVDRGRWRSLLAIMLRPMDGWAAWCAVRDAAVFEVHRRPLDLHPMRYGRRQRLGERAKLPVYAVLSIPEEVDSYFRGRSRQALRTNVSHARDQGYRCAVSDDHAQLTVATETMRRAWRLPDDNGRIGNAGELVVLAHDRLGGLAGVAAVDVRGGVGLLGIHVGMVESSHVRYLLHDVLVREIAKRGVGLLVAERWYGTEAGLRYFQRRLGYAPARIKWARRAAVASG